MVQIPVHHSSLHLTHNSSVSVKAVEETPRISHSCGGRSSCTECNMFWWNSWASEQTDRTAGDWLSMQEIPERTGAVMGAETLTSRPQVSETRSSDCKEERRYFALWQLFCIKVLHFENGIVHIFNSITKRLNHISISASVWVVGVTKNIMQTVLAQKSAWKWDQTKHASWSDMRHLRW